MTRFFLLVVSVLCVLVAHGAVAAPKFVAAVDALAQPILLGMQLSSRRGAQRKVVSEAANDCVQALKPSVFHDVVERILSKAFGETEFAAVDRFFRTPVGKKYLKHGILQLYPIAGEALPEPLPVFSDAEHKEVESFAATGAGQLLFSGKAMQSPAAQQAYDTRIHELLERCKARPGKVGLRPNALRT